MKTKEDVIELITGMRLRWGMYAMTKEAFLGQINMLLYIFVEGFNGRDFDYSFRPKPGPSCEWLLERVTEEFAHRACDAALAILNGGPLPPSV